MSLGLNRKKAHQNQQVNSRARGSYSGNTLAFQAKARSSILLPRSIFLKKVDMKAKTLSRGPSIDTSKCVANVGGRFDLVLIASARAREIARKHRFDEKTTQVNAPVSALLEIQEGKIGREYLKKV